MIPLEVGCGQGDKTNLDLVCKLYKHFLELSHLCCVGVVVVLLDFF